MIIQLREVKHGGEWVEGPTVVRLLSLNFSGGVAGFAPAKETFKDADTLIVGFEKMATTRPVEKFSHPMHGEV